MTELRPCPFCGGEAKHGYDGDPIFGRIVHWVYCKECHAKTRESSDEDFVIESWNTRPNPWHTGTPAESGEYLVCIRYDFGKKGYTTANYVEPYNPHTGWYNLKPPSVEDGHEWCKKHGIEVIAWQKITPFVASKEK